MVDRKLSSDEVIEFLFRFERIGEPCQTCLNILFRLVVLHQALSDHGILQDHFRFLAVTSVRVTVLLRLADSS